MHEPVSTNDLPTITPPRQSRSRATMERVLAAVEELLEDKPFEQITIAEVASRSNSSPTSIYARFADKTAILLAVHERFKHRAETLLYEEFGSGDAVSCLPDRTFSAYARHLVELYHRHRQLLRSALLADSDLMYQRGVDVISTTSQVLSDRLRPAMTAPGPEAEKCIDFTVRTAVAVMQQQILFKEQASERFDITEDELVSQLSRMMIDTTVWIFQDR